MNINGRIAQYAESVDEPEVIADKVLDSIMGMSKADIREELRPLVLNAVTDVIRARTLCVERAAEGIPRSGAPETDPNAARKALLLESFYSYDRHERVRWGDATIEDHLSYAAMLRGQMASLLETAVRHEDAARRIEQANVSCLFDLEAQS